MRLRSSAEMDLLRRTRSTNRAHNDCLTGSSAAYEELGRPDVKCGSEQVALVVRDVGQDQAAIRVVVGEVRSDPADVGQRATAGPGDPPVELEVDDGSW